MIFEFGGEITNQSLFEVEDPGNCAIIAILGSTAVFCLNIRTVEGKTCTCTWGPVAKLDSDHGPLLFPAACKTGYKLEFKEFDYSETKISKAIKALLNKTANGYGVEAAQVVTEEQIFPLMLGKPELYFFNKRPEEREDD